MARKTANPDSDHDALSRQAGDTPPLDAQDTRPLDANEQAAFDDLAGNFDSTATEPTPEAIAAGTDQAEAFANDPANHGASEDAAGVGSAPGAGAEPPGAEGGTPEDGAPETASHHAAEPTAGADHKDAQPEADHAGHKDAPHLEDVGKHGAGSRASGGFAKPAEPPAGKPRQATRPAKEAAAPQPADGQEQKQPGGIAAAATAAGATSPLAKLKVGFGAAREYGSKNKKSLLVGGGLAGILTAIIMSFFALLPLKVEAMVKSIYGEAFARVEHIIERRIEKMIIKYAFEKAGRPTDGAVATGNPLGDLYKTWRVVDTQDKFLGQEGLKINQGGTSRSIKVSLGNGTQEFDSESQFAEYLDKELTGKEARSFLAKVARDQTKWHQVVKRRHIRKWMAKAYGICTPLKPCWKFFDEKESDKSAKDNFDAHLSESEDKGYLSKMGKMLTCILSSEGCPTKTPASTDPPATPPSAEGAEVGKAAEKATADALVKSASAKIGEVVAEALIKVVSSKAIPIIGWIDLGAHIDDFLYYQRYVPIVQEIRKTQYAGVFVTWIKIADQIKDGTITAAQVNAALTKLDGMEMSRAFQELFMGKAAGQDVDADKTLAVGGGAVGDLTKFYKSAFLPVHAVLWAYLHTIGFIVNLLGDLVGKLFSLIPGVSTLEQWVSEFLVKVLMWIIGPVITPKDGGLQIMNAVRVGADVVANEFSEYQLGGVPVTAKLLMETNNAIAEENRTNIAHTSLWNRLFSTTSDQPSFISRLAVTVPSSPTTATIDSFNSMLALIANPLSAFNGGFQLAYSAASDSTLAASAEDRYGVTQIGAPEDQLNALVDQKQVDDLQKAADKAAADGRNLDKIRPEDCPDVPEGKYNICRSNITAIQTGKAMFTTNDDGGWNSDPLDAPTGAGGAPAGAPPGGFPPSNKPADLLKFACTIQGSLLNELDCAAYYAKLIIASPNVIKTNKVPQDLAAAANKQGIHNSDTTCAAAGGASNTAFLHPVLLYAIYEAATAGGFKITLWNIVSGHGCDQYFHPHGRATDIGALNGVPTDSSMSNPAKYNQPFAEYIYHFLPERGEILQANKCFPAKLPPWISDDYDTCNHIHVSVGGLIQ
jgi:hypothetical protein